MSPTDLAKAADISVPYASQLLSDDPLQKRQPSRSLAFRIFRRTSLKLGPLANLSDAEIDQLEKLEAKAA